MNDILQFSSAILYFLIDLFSLGLIAAIFYVIGLAIITMARNQQPRWDSIAYVVVILLSAIWLLQWYPKQVVSSIRVALRESRPEADALRDELQLWLPGLQLTAVPIAPATAVITVLNPLATASATAVETQTPPTPTTIPTETPTSMLDIRPTAVATFDPSTWNPLTPAPTPSAAGGGQ